jgi:hypothetical protein
MSPPRTTLCRALVAGALALAALAPAGHAEPHVRNGWFAGFGYGGSWGQVNFEDDQRAEWSGTWTARAGYALDQDLLLGVEYLRWAKDYAIATLDGDIPVGVALSGTLLAVSYFPGNAGFMLRGGLGVATADVDEEPPAGVEPQLAGVSPDAGLAALVCAGYEARLTARFALGAVFEVLYLGVSDDALDDAYVYGLNVQFNWYW